MIGPGTITSRTCKRSGMTLDSDRSSRAADVANRGTYSSQAATAVRIDCKILQSMIK